MRRQEGMRADNIQLDYAQFERASEVRGLAWMFRSTMNGAVGKFGEGGKMGETHVEGMRKSVCKTEGKL